MGRLPAIAALAVMLGISMLGVSGNAQQPVTAEPHADVARVFRLLNALSPTTPSDFDAGDCPARAVDDLSTRAGILARDGRTQEMLGWIRLRVHSGALTALAERNPGLDDTSLISGYKAVAERPLEACAVAIRNATLNALASALTDAELRTFLAAPRGSDNARSLGEVVGRLSASNPLFAANGLDVAAIQAVRAVLQQQASALSTRGIHP